MKFLLKYFGIYVPKLTFQRQKRIFGGLKRVVRGEMRNFHHHHHIVSNENPENCEEVKPI
jgi:hypothetical protein